MIIQDYYAPGSLSTAQFQIQVYYTNNTQYNILPTLNLIMMYSGILSTSNGSSSAYTSGILSKENVLNSMAVPKPLNAEKLARYVGSGLGSSLKSIASAVMPVLKRDVLEPSVQALAQDAVSKLTRKLKQ